MITLAERARWFVQWCDHNILIPVTLCCILGTVIGHQQYPDIPHTTIPYLLLTLLAVAAFSLCFRHKKTALFLTLPLFMVVGYLNTVHQLTTPLSAGHLYNLVNQQSKVTLVGTLITMVEQDGIKSRFEIKVQEIMVHDNHASLQPAHGRVRLSMYGTLETVEPGDTLMILAKVNRTTNYKIPGAFDYQGYMAARDVYVSGWISDNQDIIKVRDRPPSSLQQIRYRPEQVRQKIDFFLRQNLDSNISGLYRALLIGSRAGVSPDVQEQF